MAVLRWLRRRLADYRTGRPGQSRYQILSGLVVRTLNGEVYRKISKELATFNNFAPLRRVQEDKPSIVIAALPRSGSQYVSATLASQLGYSTDRFLWSGEFPNCSVKPRMAGEFGLGGLIADGPLACTPNNMQQLEKHGLRKVVLHVRDPRAAIYSQTRSPPSTADMLTRLRLSRGTFSALSHEQQLDYFIDAFFEDSIAWLNAWVDAIEGASGNIEIRVMNHETLVNNEEAYIQSIFDFYGLVPRPDTQVPQNEMMSPTDPWREAVTSAQHARMTEMIPDRLFQYFGWQP
jgi:hypothetical protein